jgi:hypothetical protein
VIASLSGVRLPCRLTGEMIGPESWSRKVCIPIGRITTHPETNPVQGSSCGKRLETFTLTQYCGISAFDDGFEAVGFLCRVPEVYGKNERQNLKSKI